MALDAGYGDLSRLSVIRQQILQIRSRDVRQIDFMRQAEVGLTRLGRVPGQNLGAESKSLDAYGVLAWRYRNLISTVGLRKPDHALVTGGGFDYGSTHGSPRLVGDDAMQPGIRTSDLCRCKNARKKQPDDSACCFSHSHTLLSLLSSQVSALSIEPGLKAES